MEVKEETQTEASTEQLQESTPQVSVPNEQTSSETSEKAPSTESLSAEPAEAYVPNFKFKVANEEKEFDDRLKSLIKTKEDEDYVRDLATKAHGIEITKSKAESYRMENESLKEKYSSLSKDAATVMSYVEKKDLNSLVNLFDFSKKDVLNLAKQYLDYENLPPEQKKEYDRFRELENSNQHLQKQYEDVVTHQKQMLVKQRQAEINTALTDRNVADIVSKFDQINGQGSFQNEVILRGQHYWATQGIDKPAHELVTEIVNKYGLTHLTSRTINAGSPQTQTVQQTGKAALPVLPNTSNSGTSAPVKRKPKSLIELRKLIGS